MIWALIVLVVNGLFTVDSQGRALHIICSLPREVEPNSVQPTRIKTPYNIYLTLAIPEASMHTASL